MLNLTKNSGLVAMVALFVSLTALTIVLVETLNSQTIKYVSIGDLVEQFAMTKEKKGQLEGLHFRRKGILDSMEFQLKQAERQIMQGNKALESDYQFKREYYFEKAKAFEEENS